MAFFVYYTIITLCFIITIKLLVHYLYSRRFRNLPPGPPTLPIIGNLHQLKQPIHHTFSDLSQTYGNIFSLWFGSCLVVVVSSPSLVHECFTTNDIVLANRPPFLAGKYLFFNNTTLGSVPYGDLYCNLRRIITEDVLSNHRLNSFVGIQRDEIKRLVEKLREETSSNDGFVKVELRSRLDDMVFNLIIRMMSGKRYYGEDHDVSDAVQARKFREIISEMMALLGANNKGDFLPMLKLFDLDNLEKRLKRIATRIDALLQGLIDEQRIELQNGRDGDTMIDHLLKLQESQPEYYSDQVIKGLIQSMLIAGTGAAVVSMEWMMAELLNNPEVLMRAKDEIDKEIGKDRLLDEQDLSKLPYLQNIVSETLRLHPATPLLLPHYSSEVCTIGGYKIPKGTILMTNAWLIHRDPKYWSENVMSFRPERFEKKNEVNKLIAFGLGRRACPGLGLARRTLGFTVGLLIQCFEWKRITEEKIDMTEDNGITMPMKIPFQTMCKALPIVNDIMK